MAKYYQPIKVYVNTNERLQLQEVLYHRISFRFPSVSNLYFSIGDGETYLDLTNMHICTKDSSNRRYIVEAMPGELHVEIQPEKIVNNSIELQSIEPET